MTEQNKDVYQRITDQIVAATSDEPMNGECLGTVGEGRGPPGR